MNTSNIWLLKTKALLHDPPDKPLDIRGHEGQAQRWARQLGISLSRDAFKKADWIASAADRLNFPGYKTIGAASFSNKPYLAHPLAGVRLNLGAGRLLPTQVDEAALYQAIEDSLTDIPSDPKERFLWLWRNWSTQIQQAEGNQLGVLWDLLPADTRIPDHSIWAHQALTSAIAATQPDETSDPDPAFLLFTIGPVQAFISAARRTQDLWAGSYLLSYLNWAAIEVIAEAIGPDAVIFPNLYGQPLCDRWLSQKGIVALPRAEDLILPSLPNRFLAIVPRDQGANLAKQAEARLRSQWREITQAVKSDLEQLFNNNPPAWSRTWERQTENLFEVYWQVYPWRPEGHPIQDAGYRFIEPHRPFLGDRSSQIETILQEYAKPEREGGGQYQPNIGAIYGELYFITEKALGSRKGLRNFAQVSETGEKSTLGGDRAALYDGIDDLDIPESDFDSPTSSGRGRRPQIRKFWEDLSKKLQEKGQFEIAESGERLDAIELTKRCAWRSYFQQYLDIQPSQTSEAGEEDQDEEKYELRFPSTSSIATASFKAAVIDAVLGVSNRDQDDLCKSLQTWINAVWPISRGNRCHEAVIPQLASRIEPRDGLLSKFLRLEGRLLFPETYDRDDEWPKNIGRDQRQQARSQLKAFLKQAQERNIPKPRKYFAILMMDGDNMGQWVSGDKMPHYQQVLHPDTREALKDKENWKTILESPRLMAPAVHGFISRALGDFSLKLVRHIVEYRYPGKLVYAGGDDVLALLPVDCALKVARELRAAFSGEVYTGEIGTGEAGTKFEVKFGDSQTRSGYLYLKPSGATQARLFATMGHTATASTGIAIAHYMNPLDLALNAVREAEKAAKKQEGRNAFRITFLKRSGEEMQAGAKWFYGKQENKEESNKEQPELIKDTVALLQRFQDHFAQEQISSKFPYILREQAETLSALRNKDINQAEIQRLLHRQQGKQKLTEEEEKDLAKQLAELVAAAEDAQTGKNQEGKLKTFADLLVFTRFLATAEGEESE
ncbi:CRISPR-associated protein Cas10/Cmr2, subtype III-B [Leptolyngbyaceae cyanobacterium JSC-12]|nr:CRISPR-associated protein Cas10/Cmr2, subtype III-B [Leptolyngbyaceae cyanobacterium JSC-12]